MRLICKLGDYGVQAIDVNTTDRLSVLLDLLNLNDKNSKFIYKGRTYQIYSNQTFEEIRLTKNNTTLFIINQAISG
jgi:hypothetical protein